MGPWQPQLKAEPPSPFVTRASCFGPARRPSGVTYKLIGRPPMQTRLVSPDRHEPVPRAYFGSVSKVLSLTKVVEVALARDGGPRSGHRVATGASSSERRETRRALCDRSSAGRTGACPLVPVPRG